MRRILAALFLVCSCGTSFAEGEWISFRFAGGFADQQGVSLIKWINDTCQPDEMGNIVGFSYQVAPGAPLNLEVFCRTGKGALGRVKIERIQYTNDYFFTEDHLRPVKSAVVIGFDLAGKNGDSPTGTVLMIVRQ